MRKQRAFTLIEVLVALVIVAVAVAAVLGSLTSAANSTVYLRDKTFANWIALNKLSETRLAAAAPVDGKTDGVITYAGRSWQWQQEVGAAQIPGLKRIDVRVRSLSDSKSADAVVISPKTAWTYEATGFFGAAVAAPSTQLPVWEPAPKAPAGNPGNPPGSATGVPSSSGTGN